MREFMPCECGEFVLVEILVVGLIEVADINAILKIFRSHYNISGCQISPLTGSDTCKNQQYVYNQVYIIPHTLNLEES